MSDLPAPLEERIARLEADPQVAVGADFDAGGWLWILALGVALPVALLIVGWWYVPGNH